MTNLQQLLNVIILLLTLISGCDLAISSIVVRSTSPDPGNLKINLVLPAHHANRTKGGFGKTCCGKLAPNQALLVSQFRRVVQEVNDAGVLPAGIRLGYDIVDTCSSESFATSQVLDWLQNRLSNLNDGSAAATSKEPPIAFVVGTGYSRTSQAVAPLFGRYGIPMIDYGSTSPMLSNRNMYGLFSRVTASDTFLARAMADLTIEWGWQCVHLLYSIGDYGENGGEAAARHLLGDRICISGSKPIGLPLDQFDEEQFDTAMAAILESGNIRPIICMCEDTSLKGLLRALKKQLDKDNKEGKTNAKFYIIAGDFWGNEMNLNSFSSDVTEGSITLQTVGTMPAPLSPGRGDSLSLGEWIRRQLGTVTDNEDPWLNEFMENTERCTLKESHPEYSRCNPSDFDTADLPPTDWVAHLTNAIYAGVVGLQDFYNARCGANKFNCDTSFDISTDGNRLYKFIINATFALSNGKTFKFFNHGDGYPHYEIDRYGTKFDGSAILNNYEEIGTWKIDSKSVHLQLKPQLDLNAYRPGSSNTCQTGLCKFNCTAERIISSDSFDRPDTGFCYYYEKPGDAAVSEKPEESSSIVLPIVATVLSAIIAALIAVIILLLVRKTTKQQEKESDYMPMSEAERFIEEIIADEACSIPTYEQQELRTLFSSASIDSNSLAVTDDVLGRGRNGIVYIGFLKTPKSAEKVAVKALKSKETYETLDFVKEGSVMHSCNHTNVLNLIGLCVTPEKQLYIVVPFMPDGDLRSFLQRKGSELKDLSRSSLIVQICAGMEYLASRNCIHRDLACRNVLTQVLPYIILVKIADFGLARALNESDYYAPNDRNRPIPVRWWPPESLQGSFLFEERCDVWSFGIVCWEIYSNGERPYDALSNLEVLEYVINGGHPDRPLNCSIPVYVEIMKKCWQIERMARPRFTDLLKQIERHRQLRFSHQPRESDSRSSYLEAGNGMQSITANGIPSHFSNQSYLPSPASSGPNVETLF